MLEWFSDVLCWKYAGAIDSSTVANAYVWLSAKFGSFAGYASCDAAVALQSISM